MEFPRPLDRRKPAREGLPHVCQTLPFDIGMPISGLRDAEIILQGANFQITAQIGLDPLRRCYGS